MLQRSGIARLEKLESRRLRSAVYPTVYEQYMVELYNWARANPAAAEAKYHVALNEGPPYTAISSDAKQPLAINLKLTDSARTFTQWMIDHDQFGHYVDGSDPQGRITAAGYSFGGSYGDGENLALYGSYTIPDPTTTVDRHFSNLYTDQSILDRGHRVNIMNPAWKEIGAGISSGPYTSYNAMISAQDFAYSGSASFLTGVAYTDTSANNFYTPGEQMANVTITAIRDSDHQSFTTTSWTSGGYTLALPAGSYTVWGSGGSLSGFVKYDDVVIESQNVKRDFRPDFVNSSTGPGSDPQPPQEQPFATLIGGKLNIVGTADDDVISVSLSGGKLSAAMNGHTLAFTTSKVTSIVISGGSGNDHITIGAGIIGTTVYGGTGADSIQGGDGADMLKGDAGNDTIFGGAGNDRIYGMDGNDSLKGDTGADRIWGGAGNDALFGGSHNDTLYGETGNDSLWGQNQNDLLDGGTGADYLSGGLNIDTVDYSTRTAALFVELTATANLLTNHSGESGENDNVLNDIENINGGAGNDRLIGSASANIIHGNAGNDTIYGMSAADTLFGDAGNDRFFASDSSRDSIDGGLGKDVASMDLHDLLRNVESH